ncbi:BamA/TamA family outer membrane protein [Wenyingzhuangia sp. 1_MG-2023]|nr:BamA/TamA family outer membrane protein [Wenyingzhuangia sp. 1_MG-2023]
MKFFYFFSFFILAVIANINSWAQEKPATFILKDSLSTPIPINNIHSATELRQTLYKEGYFYFTSETIERDSLSYLISLGQKTNTVVLKDLPKDIQLLFNVSKNYLYISPKQVPYWIEKVKDYFDSKGENFSEIQLINQISKNDTLHCSLSIKSSPKRFIDKIVIKGYERFPKQFLKHYINTKKPFSKELLMITEKKINQISFVRNIKTPAVLFTKDSTHLYLYLEKVKANKLDALLGFNNEEGQNKIKFNGYVDISLINALHKGESFAFKWNNSGQDQEEIDLNLESPYIFKSPVNFGYHLNIYKQDSSFVNNQNKISLSYQPHYKHTLSTYYQTESSTTLIDISNNEEYQKNMFGFTYTYLELNNLRLPKTRFLIDFAYGSKKTEINTQQQLLKTDFIYNIELNPSNHFFVQNRNAYLNSKNKSTNELFRTGGATTMRGFLEQSITAHLYNYTNLEYRFFTNAVSYLYGFSDVGYFKNLNQESNLLSFGLGYTLGTASGLLKISYAVGKDQNSSFNLSTGLFHINFVTIF